ncbi:MAG: hypothetical protein DMF82_16805 [Acidobacteria bacterium]|nr:MAG: hypothetical protein DMF82_16805 [Acidobacteriota bacterium]
MVIEHLKSTAAALSERCLSDVRSLEEWKRQRPALRGELLYMLGLDPFPERTPLKPQVTGTLTRPDYRIEKLVFQSLPGLYVTANLYLPASGSGPLPAILYVCGHAPHPLGAKSYYQDRAAWFASHGYVCLILDTLEFGEVAGIHHGIHDLNIWNWLSLGYTPAGVEVWNAMRAIDYLETRPEVDPRRIGMTGVSGGGATTWFTTAVDERVAVAVPGLSTYTFASQAAHWVAAGQCDCIYFHNTYLRDFPIVGALIAPRPLLFFSGRRDPDFPPDGYHAVYGKVKSVYDLYAGGSSPQIREVDDDVGHSDPPRFRRETREWMNRWLRNDATPVAEEPDVEAGAEPAETLACLSGPPRDAINYHVHDLFTSPVRLTAPANAVGPALRRKDLIAQLREKVFRWFPRESLPFETTVSLNDGGWAARYADYKDVEFTSEAGVRIRAQLLRPKGQPQAPLLIYAKRAGDSIYFLDLDELLPVLGRYERIPVRGDRAERLVGGPHRCRHADVGYPPGCRVGPRRGETRHPRGIAVREGRDGRPCALCGPARRAHRPGRLERSSGFALARTRPPQHPEDHRRRRSGGSLRAPAAGLPDGASAPLRLHAKGVRAAGGGPSARARAKPGRGIGGLEIPSACAIRCDTLSAAPPPFSHPCSLSFSLRRSSSPRTRTTRGYSTISSRRNRSRAGAGSSSFPPIMPRTGGDR